LTTKGPCSQPSLELVSAVTLAEGLSDQGCNWPGL